MRPSTLMVLALTPGVLTAPSIRISRLEARGILAGIEAVSGRQIPPPDPVLCAKRQAECQCDSIDKSTSEGFWEYYQCTTNFFCEWCKGLWSSPPASGAAAQGGKI